MTRLTLALTHHDLPPKWDGWPVEWEGWGWSQVILCSPRPARQDVCQKCGHVGEQAMNTGVAREPWPFEGRFHAKRLLIAFRCSRCRHDVVTCDFDGWKTWDLEPSDYLDEGSFA